MSHTYTPGSKSLNLPGRDSFELASLAETDSSAQKEDDSDTTSLSGAPSSRRLSFENEDPLDSDNPMNALRRGRGYSVTSTFDFTPTLFPLSTTAGAGYTALGAPSTLSLSLDRRAGGENLEKRKTLTYLNGLSLVIGLIIGSGIFSSPAQVSAHVGSPGASLIVWTVSGFLAWTGAASYAELGGAIPLNGGAQVYLAKIFGELAGFLFTWSAILVLKPGSAAIIAIILGEYTIRAIIGSNVEEVNPWINKAPAVVALVIVTAINCISTRASARVGDVFMFFKFVALIAVFVIGLVVAVTGLSYSGPANTDWKTKGWFEDTSPDVSNWAVALYAGLWAYDGWDNTNYVTGEFKNPSRDLPRVLHTAMPAVIACYLLANVSYYLVLPKDVIDASNTVAVQLGQRAFGPVGALVLALVVSASAFGALNANTFTSGRLMYVAGREGYIPSMFGRLGLGSGEQSGPSRFQKRSALMRLIVRVLGDDGTIGSTPINAVVLNAFLTLAYIIVGEFKTLITFYGVVGYTFYFLTVLGLVVLRIREPNLERPYKTWITTPIIFCCLSLFLVSRAVIAQPLQTVIVLAFVVSGIPVYFWRIHARDGGGAKGLGHRPGNGEDSIGWKFWKRFYRK